LARLKLNPCKFRNGLHQLNTITFDERFMLSSAAPRAGRDIQNRESKKCRYVVYTMLRHVPFENPKRNTRLIVACEKPERPLTKEPDITKPCIGSGLGISALLRTDS
jgi:hypothetical protein